MYTAKGDPVYAAEYGAGRSGTGNWKRRIRRTYFVSWSALQYVFSWIPGKSRTGGICTCADVAWDVLRLTPQQLRDPIQAVEKGGIPGLRLIPYRAVGQPGGMLLVAAMDSVVIGGQQVGRLVAFAPEKIGADESYQALAGGAL